MSGRETMTDVAYNCLSNHQGEMDFLSLWKEVASVMNIPEDKVRRKKSQFYSELSLDNRFASLEANHWDLRNRRKFNEVHLNTEELDSDDDEDTSEESEEDKEADYESDEDNYDN